MELKVLIKNINRYYPLIFTIIFIILLTQYSFSTVEAIFYDLRVKTDVLYSHEKDIVVITLDEQSDEFLGEVYPYTYSTHHKLLKNIIKDKPKLISYFVNLDEPSNEQEQINLEKFKKEIEAYQSTGGGFRFGTYMDSLGEYLPPRDLRSLGYSLGILNIDSNSFARDEVSRRTLLGISGEEAIHLWIANFYRGTKGERPLETRDVNGSYYITEADANFSLYRFSTSPLDEKTEIMKLPFHKVAVGNMPDGFFKDKIILLGSQYISNYDDFILTPFNKERLNAPRINLHALIIEALINNKTVTAVPRIISSIVSIMLAFFLSFIIFRVDPSKGLFITVMTMVIVVFLSFVTFNLFGIWLYLVHIIYSIFIVYYICVPFRAIQEYQRRYAIQEETKLLKQVDRLKQNFISLMSHDLKTPVARITGITEILKTQHSLDQEQGRLVDNISKTTQELNQFITSILDLTKVESRRLTINMEQKDINRVITTVVDRLRFDANNKNVELEDELAPLYPIKIDTQLINRVISNLVENAIKYSGENSIVTIKTWDDEEWVYVRISDNGVGISPEDLENIFDKFYRVKNDANHTVKGSGLGLYLVKYFVELHEGTIEASSEIGQGTSFLIKLKNA